ncbi:MAG: carboxypeptidase-like regulatory domain-containing protein, partial [Bacteroidia bacterium]
MIRLLMAFCLCLSTIVYSAAQTTVIKGRVFASETREPLAYALIVYGDFLEVVRSDFEGYFSITTKQQADSLSCAYTGYRKIKAPVRYGDSQEINFELEREVVQDREVVIRVKGNPADRIMKSASEKREFNDPDRLDQWECESFTRITIAVNNISENLRKRKIGQQIGPLFDTIAFLSADSQRAVLPVFMSESLSDYYYNRNPRIWKETIRASRLKGVGIQDGTFVSQVIGSSFVSYNFYKNTIVILDK